MLKKKGTDNVKMRTDVKKKGTDDVNIENRC